MHSNNQSGLESWTQTNEQTRTSVDVLHRVIVLWSRCCFKTPIWLMHMKCVYIGDVEEGQYTAGRMMRLCNLSRKAASIQRSAGETLQWHCSQTGCWWGCFLLSVQRVSVLRTSTLTACYYTYFTFPLSFKLRSQLLLENKTHRLSPSTWSISRSKEQK